MLPRICSRPCLAVESFNGNNKYCNQWQLVKAEQTTPSKRWQNKIYILPWIDQMSILECLFYKLSVYSVKIFVVKLVPRVYLWSDWHKFSPHAYISNMHVVKTFFLYFNVFQDPVLLLQWPGCSSAGTPGHSKTTRDQLNMDSFLWPQPFVCYGTMVLTDSFEYQSKDTTQPPYSSQQASAPSREETDSYLTFGCVLTS